MVRSTYAAELHTLLDAANQALVLRYCFVEILTGSTTAVQLLDVINQARNDDVICVDGCIDARSVFDSVTAEIVKTPYDKHLLLHALAMREHLDAGRLRELIWIDTVDMVSDGLTKGSIDREALIRLSEKGEWELARDEPVMWPSEE